MVAMASVTFSEICIYILKSCNDDILWLDILVLSFFLFVFFFAIGGLCARDRLG
jgi:hypothetical protein